MPGRYFRPSSKHAGKDHPVILDTAPNFESLYVNEWIRICALKAECKKNGRKCKMYKHVIKRLIDLILSSVGIIVLALPMLIIAVAIKIDDPGPVLFKQKRVGKKKNGEITYFMIWKFRSMKMSTPHDTPTHLLENPDRYITRVGRFIRKTSLDELPQIYQVFTSKLSAIGERAIIETTKKSADFSRVVTVNSISL